MSARSRLIKGFGATAVGPLITALVQIVSVPAFLRAWGPHLYGQWLILSAAPTYLSITDLGFGSVAGNDMAMRVAASDYKGALETFQSIWLLVSAITLLIGSLACGFLLTAPVATWLRITGLTQADARLVLLLLSIYALGTLQASVLLSGFRSDGAYAYGVSGLNVVRLVENAAMLTPIFFGGTPVQVALAAAVVRTAGTCVLYVLLCRKVSWLRLGVADASLRRIKDLTRPAMAFMAFPAGNAFSIQGMTVLMGIVLGPVSVATFNPMRTLSRFAYQIIDSVKNALWPELSAAYGAQNWALARRLHRSCCQIAFWFAIAAVIGLALLGPTIFRIWTHDKVHMDLRCFLILLVVVIASSLWNTSSAVSIAANMHERVALNYLLGTLGSLALAFALMPRLQMVGAAIALLAADVWMGCSVVRGSNELLRDDTKDFIGSIFAASKLRLLFSRADYRLQTQTASVINRPPDDRY